MITNAAAGTNLHEIAAGIFRINTPVQIPGGPEFNFNQYLVAGDEALLFHTGPRRMFPLVAEAIGKRMPLETRRCCSIPVRGSCFRWCGKRWGESCPSSACATWLSRTSRPTNAAR